MQSSLHAAEAIIDKRVVKTSECPDKPAVALVYMPWGGIERGSIALGILKQCASRMGVRADVHYLNIKFAEMLGLEFYQNVSNGEPLLPEWFFSYALFGPQGLGLIRNSWDDLMRSRFSPMIKKSMEKAGWNSSTCQGVTDLIPAFIEDCIASTDWSRYSLVGFSTTFAQTTASLLLSKRIKECNPAGRIAFGGANADSEIGLELIKAFEWIDYVVHGEAEKTFPLLVKNVLAGNYSDTIPGVSIRTGDAVAQATNTSMVLGDLNESPLPDYGDYMAQVQRVGINKLFPVVLPFESSRGCWWGAKAHCTFCGLNGGTMAFRKKDPARVYDEIMTISRAHRILRLDAVDNIMDLEYLETLLPNLAEADLDLSLFYEVKASMTKDQIRRCAAAGINRIQPGIESLSTDILRLMRKGMTAAQNIQLLKWCFEYGLQVEWNLLYGFPGERPEQYDDYPRILRQIMHLQPPGEVAPVVFERFSPYHFEREKFNLRLKPLGYYSLLYPEPLVDLEKIAYYFEGEWEGMADDMETYIAPARDVFQKWTDFWQQKTVFFQYEKGPGFLTLFDNRPLNSDAPLKTRRIKLNEMQSMIYAFCDRIQSFPTIHEMMTSKLHNPPGVAETRSMLDHFVQHGLMFREADRYLALAVRRNMRRPGAVSKQDEGNPGR